MRTLVIDCATEACSVALFADDTCLDAGFQMLGRGHAEHLVPMIAKLPENGRAERIAVNCGPGSFTGIRIGIAAGKALALAWGATMVGYTTHALVAAMARASSGETAIDVAMTGGHGEWFYQQIAADDDASASIQSLSPESARMLAMAPIAAGSCAEALAAGRTGVTAMPIWPDARAFPLLRPDDLETSPRPLYGRAPDAKPAAIPNLA